MIDRLQFRHHNEVFNSRKEAIEYITTGIGYSLSSITSGMDVMQASSLFAEPTILAYKNEDDSTNPHVILAIGSRTNPGINSELVQWDDNRFCIIDIDEVKDLIDEHYDEFIAAIKALTLIPKNSDTLNLYAASSETGTFISGDVKTEERYVFSEDSASVKNNLMVTENGLFMYVNLTYNEDKEQFTFSVSNADKSLSSTTITLPNNYITGGSYDVKDESIHLNLRNGDEVVIDCKNLIGEWTVEGDASHTPIVLTRERVYDGESELIQPWQDVLRADVRIDNEAEDNILEKSWDGTRLKVDGKASNITCWKNGEKLTVQEALNNLHELKVSNDSRNIIFEKIDGVFSTVNLEYKPNENKLLFTVSGRGISGEPTVTTEEIQLNTISLFKNVWYDSITEELVIEWVDDSGETHYSRISIGQMIEEWEPQNEGHSVEVSRVRNVGGKDKVSADVKIANTQPNNILEDVNHELYVNGTASNIKYNATGTTNVKQVLDNLSANTTFLSGAIDSVSAIVDTNIERIDNTIGTGFTDDPHDNITYKFNEEVARATARENEIDNNLNQEIQNREDDVNAEEARAISEENRIEQKLDAEIVRSENKDNEHDERLDTIDDEIEELSANTLSSIKNITSIDNSIKVTKSVGNDPTVDLSFNISSEKEYDVDNIIKLEADGLYVGVDLDIVSGVSGNVLIFKSTNGTKEIPLKTNSIIDKIWYDPIREAIIIEYTVNGQRMPDVVVPVGGLIEEWEVEEGHPFAIQLNRKRVGSGSTGHDILSASAITSSDADNILIIKDNALKVSNVDIVANANAIAQEIQDRINDVNAEEARAKDEELILNNKIGTGFTDASDNNVTAKFNALSGAVNNEIIRATTSEIALDDKIDDEIARATSAETALNTKINNEITRAENAEEDILHNLQDEINRATAAEATISNNLADEVTRATNVETVLQTAINNEITRSTNKDNELTAALTAETTRATSAETTLNNKIDDETTRAENAEEGIIHNLQDEINRATAAETAISTSLNNEITRATNAETALQTALTNEVTRSTNKDNELTAALTTETTRATSAETALQTALTNEVTRSTNKDNEHDTNITQLRSDLTSEVTRSTNKDNELTAALTAETTRATSAETALQTALTNETNRATSAEADLQREIDAEETRAQTAEASIRADLTTEHNNRVSEDTRLENMITAETAEREADVARLENEITSITLDVRDTNSVDLSLDDRTITADVKISSKSDNIIYLDSAGGIEASVNLSYDSGRNELIFKKTNLTGGTDTNTITLNAGSIIDSVTYDDVNKQLVVVYHDAQGQSHTVNVPVDNLFNEWAPVTDHLGAVLLTKTQGTGTHGADELRATAVISTLPTNILVNDGGSLYVDGSGISAVTDMANSISGELKTFETVVLGQTLPDGGGGYTYQKHTTANYIFSATSLDNADVILDIAIKNTNDNLNITNNNLNILSGKVIDIQSEVDRIENGAGLDENGDYIVNNYGHYISAATSLGDADTILDQKIYNLDTTIQNLANPEDTATVHLYNTDGKLKADVKKSASTVAGDNMIELMSDGLYVGGQIDCGTYEGNTVVPDYSNTRP